MLNKKKQIDLTLQKDASQKTFFYTLPKHQPNFFLQTSLSCEILNELSIVFREISVSSNKKSNFATNISSSAKKQIYSGKSLQFKKLKALKKKRQLNLLAIKSNFAFLNTNSKSLKAFTPAVLPESSRVSRIFSTDIRAESLHVFKDYASSYKRGFIHFSRPLILLNFLLRITEQTPVIVLKHLTKGFLCGLLGLIIFSKEFHCPLKSHSSNRSCFKVRLEKIKFSNKFHSSFRITYLGR